MTKENLELLATIATIIIPIITGTWFFWDFYNKSSNSYFKELEGSYAGFTKPVDENSDIPNGGFLLRILNIDSNGYFQGEFDYGENLTTISNNQVYSQQMRDGFYNCLGKMEYHLTGNIDRHPMNHEENRVYEGKFYVYDRFDIDFKNVNYKVFVQLEYNITHYREMKVIEFNLHKVHREVCNLPKTFTLYKTIGLTYDVYDSVKNAAFRDAYRRK